MSGIRAKGALGVGGAEEEVGAAKFEFDGFLFLGAFHRLKFGVKRHVRYEGRECADLTAPSRQQ